MIIMDTIKNNVMPIVIVSSLLLIIAYKGTPKIEKMRDLPAQNKYLLNRERELSKAMDLTSEYLLNIQNNPSTDISQIWYSWADNIRV
jgi:hypothetical protein